MKGRLRVVSGRLRGGWNNSLGPRRDTQAVAMEERHKYSEHNEASFWDPSEGERRALFGVVYP